MKINPANCYTSYVVVTGSARSPRFLTAPAYSPATAVFSPQPTVGGLFSTYNKAASCSRDIFRRSGGEVETYVVPLQVERRRRRA